MKSHKLNIELSFVSQSDADAMMGAIKEVADKTTPESTLSLINEIDKQTQASVGSVEDTLHFVEAKSALMAKNTEEMRGYINELSLLNKTCDEVEKRILDAMQTIEELSGKISRTVELNKSILKESHSKVQDTNKVIEDTKVSFEACQLLKELGEANLTMLTGGKMTMYSMGKHSYEVAKTWEA